AFGRILSARIVRRNCRARSEPLDAGSHCIVSARGVGAEIRTRHHSTSLYSSPDDRNWNPFWIIPSPAHHASRSHFRIERTVRPAQRRSRRGAFSDNTCDRAERVVHGAFDFVRAVPEESL